MYINIHLQMNFSIFINTTYFKEFDELIYNHNFSETLLRILKQKGEVPALLSYRQNFPVQYHINN